MDQKKATDLVSQIQFCTSSSSYINIFIINSFSIIIIELFRGVFFIILIKLQTPMGAFLWTLISQYQ